MSKETEPGSLTSAREDFVSQWGTIGSAWGINRTMAQIHALLLTAPVALSTDEIMQELQISRGNANTNLRDLVGWGLVRPVLKKGERREYFEAEKDIWKMFCIIARERKRREILPAMDVLQGCAERTRSIKTPEARAFHDQMQSLLEFLRLGERVLEHIAGSEQSRILKLAAKMIR